MALRSCPTKAFYLECDRCRAHGPQGLLPVEAHLLAGGAGWLDAPDLKQHLCNRCAPREPPVDTPLGELIDQGMEVDLSGL